MMTRIITGLVALLICIPIVIVGGLPMLAIMALFNIIGILEILNMFDKEKTFKLFHKIITVMLGAYLFLVIAYIDSMGDYNITAQGVFAIFIFIIFVESMLFVVDSEADSKLLFRSLFPIFYVGLGTGSVYLLRSHGFLVFLYMLATAFLSDIFAYFAGRFFGKHKMAPELSPKKTWEGFFGGLIISTIFSTFFAMNLDLFSNNAKSNYLLGYFTDISEAPYIVVVLFTTLITIIGVVVSVFGDLVASKLKREYGIKDYGKIFPGHGGVMDRFDSVLLTSMMLISLFTFIDFLNILF